MPYFGTAANVLGYMHGGDKHKRLEINISSTTLRMAGTFASLASHP